MKPIKSDFTSTDCIISFHEGKHWRLAIANQETLEILETFTPGLKQKNAKRIGKELASELKIPFFPKSFPQLKQKFKEQRRKDWQEEQQQRWSRWRLQFDQNELAIAQSIRIMNSWIKELGEILQSDDSISGSSYLYKRYSVGQEKACVVFAYSIKDFWLKDNQDKIVKTRKVRWEEKGWLYEYQLDIQGIEFIFHGYFQPDVISEEMASSPPQFRSGQLLTQEEKKKIHETTDINSALEFTSMLGWKLLGKRYF